MYLTDSLENQKGLICKYVKETLRTIILPLIITSIRNLTDNKLKQAINAILSDEFSTLTF